MKDGQLDAFAEYQKMVDSIFGVGVISVKRNDVGNDVINTWKYVNEFLTFRQNFQDRLVRLHNAYKDSNNIKVIHNLVANMGEVKNWEGTYAELVAYDVINTGYNDECKLDVSRDATFALAEKLGKREVNYDIQMHDDYGVFMDVKAFTDTLGDILQHSVVDYVLNQDDFKNLQIGIQPEYPFDDNDEDYKNNVKALQQELTDRLHELLEKGRNKYSYTSGVIPRLTYRILIGKGILSTTSEYNAYRRAEQLKNFVIQRYCNKLPYNDPFFLVFVNFPWFNQKDRNSFAEFNKALYRSVSRRTFMQYEHSGELIHDINPKYTGGELASFAARKVTGMIFIDDHSIIEPSQDIYIYLNPNADNKRCCMDTYLNVLSLKGKKGDLDNMCYDNY